MTAISRFLNGRGANGLVMLQVAALLAPVCVVLLSGGGDILPILLFASVVALGWDAAFATLRRRTFHPHGITTALIFILFVPPDLPLWYLVVALSLACVIGELVFGGRGFGFLSPATVALALALLSLPDLALSESHTALALASIPGAILLVFAGALSLAIALPFLAVLLLLHGAMSPEGAFLILVAALPALVFLICDPVAAAVTTPGRVVHGVLAAALTWVFSGFGQEIPSPEAFVFAALMTSIFAPLIDHGVVGATARWRTRHYE